MYFNHPVNYRYVSAFYLEDDDFSGSDWLVVMISKKQQITSVEGRLHTTATDGETVQESGVDNS